MLEVMNERHDRLIEIAGKMNAALGRDDGYEQLIASIKAPLFDVGRALENIARIINMDEMSLEERRQAFMDIILEEVKL